MDTKLGIDGIDFTVSGDLSIKEIAFNLFGIPLAKWHRYPKEYDLPWYRTSYRLRSGEGNGKTVAAIFTDYKGTNGKGGAGKNHLIQVHGLALSDSAMNPLGAARFTLPDCPTSLFTKATSTTKPFTLQRLLSYIQDVNGHITALDPYLDSFGPGVPFEELHAQADGPDFLDYLRSPFLRKYPHIIKTPDGEVIPVNQPPKPYTEYVNGVYFGRRERGACQIYNYQKHLDVHHGIYSGSDDTKLRYEWHRFEVRLRASTGRKQGKWLLSRFSDDPASLEKTILHLVTSYLAFTQPVYSRRSDNPLQDWWLQLITKAGNEATPCSL